MIPKLKSFAGTLYLAEEDNGTALIKNADQMSYGYNNATLIEQMQLMSKASRVMSMFSGQGPLMYQPYQVSGTGVDLAVPTALAPLLADHLVIGVYFTLFPASNNTLNLINAEIEVKNPLTVGLIDDDIQGFTLTGKNKLRGVILPCARTALYNAGSFGKEQSYKILTQWNQISEFITFKNYDGRVELSFITPEDYKFKSIIEEVSASLK